MKLKDAITKITPLDQAAIQAAEKQWASVAKPLGSLGVLEEDITRMAGIFGTNRYTIEKRAVIVMCADNGVVAEGVTQTGQEVTAIVAENMTHSSTSVCKMSAIARADVFPVNIGICTDVDVPGIIQCCVRKGTRNLYIEPALTRAETIQAIEAGIDIVHRLYEKGYRLFATGEMGIGNTTTTAAVLSTILDLPPEEVTGRGSGLATNALHKKIEVVKTAIAKYQPDPNDAIDVLSKVGGLDIAGLVGVYLGGALHRVPVIIDGIISSAAALLAATLCPLCKAYMLASHVSGEPSGARVLTELGLKPVIQAEMRLGEGTGAVAMLPLLDMALSVYNDMVTFEDTNIEAYQPLS
jgi:nicotinate-nucleotide--dimethylbenzimidazole phosphoribosyltransferase